MSVIHVWGSQTCDLCGQGASCYKSSDWTVLAGVVVGATRPPGVTSATVHFRNRSLPVAIIIHNYCFKTLCDNGSFSNLRDAYKLGFALRQEQNNEVDFDMIVDAFPRLYNGPNPLDWRTYQHLPMTTGWQEARTPLSLPLALDWLPPELLFCVFDRLSPSSLAACSFANQYLEDVVRAFCRANPLMKAIASFIVEAQLVPDGWEFIRQQYSVNRNLTFDVIDNVWNIEWNSRALQQIRLTEDTPCGSQLTLDDLEQPVTFFTQYARAQQCLCGVRLKSGSVFGVETETVHRTRVSLDANTPIKFYFDAQGIHGVSIGQYLWKPDVPGSSWVYRWELKSGSSVPCVFDGCKLRLLSTMSPRAPQVSVSATRTPILLEEGQLAGPMINESPTGNLYFLAAKSIRLPKGEGRITLYVEVVSGGVVGIQTTTNQSKHLIGETTGYAVHLPLGAREIVRKIEVGLAGISSKYRMSLKFYTNFKQTLLTPYLPDYHFEFSDLQYFGQQPITGLFIRRRQYSEDAASKGTVCTFGLSKCDQDLARRPPGIPPTRKTAYLYRTAQYRDRPAAARRHLLFCHFTKLTTVKSITWFLTPSGLCKGLEFNHEEGYSDILGPCQSLDNPNETRCVTIALQEDEELQSIAVEQIKDWAPINAIYFNTDRRGKVGPVQTAAPVPSFRENLRQKPRESLRESVIVSKISEQNKLVWYHNSQMDCIEVD